MTSQPDFPDLGGGPAFEHALLARAFHLLLDDGRPVSRARLAQALASEPKPVTPTPHELTLEQKPGQERRYWTWCAWDAVGILAALDASGRIRSTSPSSGRPIQLAFHHGGPQRADPDLVVFFADTDCCAPATNTRDSGCCGSGSVIDQWCPLVNFFEHADAAQAWAASHGVRGTTVPLAEAASQGKAAWRRWVGDHDQPSEPSEPTDQVGSRP